jgi:arylsulfatase
MGTAPDGVGVRTPFLDELAARGVRFVDCTASANNTNPSHTALMTALSPRDSGITGNLSRLAGSARTLAEAFREAGYACYASVSVNHLEPAQSGLGQGFDRFAFPPYAPHAAPSSIGTMHQWLEDAEGLPTFLWLHVFDVHGPYTPPEEYTRLYFPAERDPRDPSLPALPAEQQLAWDPEVRDPEWGPAQYRSGVTYVDDQLRAFFDHPRIAASTFAFTSDHGESLGEGGHYYTHSNLGPETLFVPLILGGDGLAAGTVVERPVEQRDIGRTLLDLAGLRDTPFPGQDLLAPEATADEVRFAIANHGSAASLVTGRWFLRMRLTGAPVPADLSTIGRHSIELFDRGADPRCEHDVAAQNKEFAGRLRKVLVRWLVEAQPLAPAATAASAGGAVDQDKLDQLTALGYTAGLGEGDEALFDAACNCNACKAYP